MSHVSFCGRIQEAKGVTYNYTSHVESTDSEANSGVETSRRLEESELTVPVLFKLVLMLAALTLLAP